MVWSTIKTLFKDLLKSYSKTLCTKPMGNCIVETTPKKKNGRNAYNVNGHYWFKKQLSAVSKQHELVTIMGSFWSVCGARGSARRYELCRRSVGISFTLQTCTLLRDEGQALLLSPGQKNQPLITSCCKECMKTCSVRKSLKYLPTFLRTLLSGPRVLTEAGSYTRWIF